MKKKSSLFMMALAVACLASSQGGEFWQKKEYRQWTERECRKLLEDSPWAQNYTFTEVLIEPLSTSGTDRAREARPEINYQAQFRSSLPIRQALVRLEQIRVKYDQLQPGQKNVADQRAKDFLAAPFPDTVVLQVAYSSNVQSNEREMARHWRSQTTETLKNFVFLIAAGEKVPLLRYSVAQGAGQEFQLIFPRQYKGHPLVGPQDKMLQLEFVHPSIGGQGESRVLIAFKIEKMLMEGAVVY